MCSFHDTFTKLRFPYFLVMIAIWQSTPNLNHNHFMMVAGSLDQELGEDKADGFFLLHNTWGLSWEGWWWLKGWELESSEGPFTQETETWTGKTWKLELLIWKPFEAFWRCLASSQHGGLRVVRLLTRWPWTQSMSVPVNKAEAASPFILGLRNHAASLQLHFSC